MGLPSPFLSVPGKMRAPAFPPRRPSALLRYLIPALLIVACLYYLSPRDRPLSTTGHNTADDLRKTANVPGKASKDGKSPVTEHPSTNSHASPEKTSKPSQGTKSHPIDRLVSAADQEFDELMSRESRSLREAAVAYRARRGRHPPPGFDEWYSFAKERNALVIEDFWDQIYHDLEPMWALPAARLRKQAWDFEMTIKVRDGVASARSDWFWTQIWLSLLKTIEHLLPDMDLALNAMDEPRLVVPWEDMHLYMSKALKTRKLADPETIVSEFQPLPPPGEGSDRSEAVPEVKWEKTTPYWLVARRGCAPTSLARTTETLSTFDAVPNITDSFAAPHMQDGFVVNYTLSTDFCHQPDIQGLNGIMVEPLSVSATDVLFPMFGGSKLAVNNEILLPAPMYWKEEDRFTGGDDHGVPWQNKEDVAVWRGVATGGRNRETNWRAFQRHRFVAMNNGTKLMLAANGTEAPANFAMPGGTYDLAAQDDGHLGLWVDSWADVSFVDLMCSSSEVKDGQCNYTSPHFATSQGVKLAEQFRVKYLPDIDGNSFSGRYLGFLRSTSLPIKATMWREWHDSRLVAWKHFVPMDNRYSDWYGIMQYFLGYGDAVDGHDEVAERIAMAGKTWAEKVLRKEDMQIYVLRLLLEYARVCDERRENLGWVTDLLGHQGG